MQNLPKSLLAFFWHFIKKQPIGFLLLFLAPISIILETNAFPYSLKLLIDSIEGFQGNRKDIFKVIAPALLFGGISWIGLITILRLQHWLQAYILPKFEADIRLSTLGYLLSQSYKYFLDQLTGNIANKVMDLPRAMESIFRIFCLNVVSTFAVILVSLILMASIKFIFSLILGLWIITQLATTIYFLKFINIYSKENAEDKSALNGTIVDAISNIISVKLFTAKNYELKYAGIKQNKEIKSNSRLIIYMNFFQLCMDIPVTIMLCAMVYFLITSWQHEIITTGGLIFVFNMMFAVMYKMWNLGGGLSNLFRDIGIARQALQLIMFEHHINDIPLAKQLEVDRGEISFKNVTFHYNKGQNIFENVNVIIKPKQKVGLVGFSGSGKSTFVNLILRFFDIESGTITIDGQDITKVTQDSLRKNIAMIPQDTNLYHRTLIENIGYGEIITCSKDTDKIIEASKKAHCHDFIMQLPDKYYSVVGEGGTKLSGGQRQRIAIARAILKEAPILILDEATSALDSVTEVQIQSSLYKLMQGRTTIVIAHRISTLTEMERILVFDKGRIIEDGTHEELLKAKGHYANLWKMQAGGFLPTALQKRKTQSGSQFLAEEVAIEV